MTEKVCRKCGVAKPMEDFHGDKAFKDGRKWSCKACEKARRATPEVRAQRQKYNRSEKGRAGQDRYRESGKKAVADNGKRLRESHLRWIAEGGQKKAARKYSQSPKGKATLRAKRQKPEYKERKRRYLSRPEVRQRWLAYARIAVQKRAALKRSLPACFTEEDWRLALEYFDHSCAYCGEVRPLAQEHFVPLAAGGPYTPDNIVPACKSCNSSKYNRPPEAWCTPPAYEKVKAYFLWLAAASA